MELINYKTLELSDLTPTLLKGFIRYQETNRVWYKVGSKYYIKDDHFVEEWNDDKKVHVVHSLQQTIETGGKVIGAFVEDQLVGFANVEGELFGTSEEYLEMSNIHVSNPYKHKGIGKELFKKCVLKAKGLGAEKIYIAAHPSVETQQFYKKMGCEYAKEINKNIYEKEPLDIQLEYVIV